LAYALAVCIVNIIAREVINITTKAIEIALFLFNTFCIFLSFYFLDVEFDQDIYVSCQIA
jgi:hypothetical protein